MNTRNTLFGAAVVLLLTGGVWWWLQPAPADVKVTAVAAPKTEAPAIPPKAQVEVPKAPAVASFDNVSMAEVAVATPAADANLKTAVKDLIAALEAPDHDDFVRNYMAPGMLETAKLGALRRMPADMTPEMRAPIEQMLQQQMSQQLPPMIQRVTQQLSQNPDAWKIYQKMGEAFKRAQDMPPMMNAAGNVATYTLETNGDSFPRTPTNLVMVLRDGKWTFDWVNTMMSMARNGQNQ